MRKKKRTKKQEAATRKMIRANKARSKAKRKKKNPLLVSATKGGKLRTKTVRKGARTSSAKKAKVAGGKKKGHAKKKAKARGGKSASAKKAARTRAEKKAKRSAAAKKGARTRKRNAGGSKKKGHAKKKAKSRSKSGRSEASYKKAAKKAARTRAANKHHKRYEREKREAEMTSYEGRKKKRAKKNPIANPIPLEGGLDFFSGMFAVVIGYLFAGGADRIGSTHALTASTATGGFTDAPAAGQIYDSEGPQTPIWSSGTRLALNALAIAVPMGLSAMIKSKGPKSFFQLMAFAAIARTGGKAAEDGMSLALKNTGFGLRVYGAELAAQGKLAAANVAQLPSAPPATFAGVKSTQVLSGTPQQTQQRIAAPPPAPALSPPAQRVAGPQTPSLDTGNRYVSGPSFNPWAATDS